MSAPWSAAGRPPTSSRNPAGRQARPTPSRAPRLVAAAWAALVIFLVAGEFGPVFKLPQAVMDISPFAHTPRLPGTAFTAAPVVSLLAVAAALSAAGLYGLRRRDLTL